LTDPKIVDFVSAALKWFEKHPMATVPSPVETVSILTENDRIRQNKPIDMYIEHDGFKTHQIVEPTPALEIAIPETETDVFTSDDLPHIREDSDQESMDEPLTENINNTHVDESEKELMIGKNNDGRTEPKTPVREQPQGYWGSILGAKTLANIVTSPLKLLSGRKANARVPRTPATEVRRSHRPTNTIPGRNAPATISHPKVVRRGFYAPSEAESDNGSVASTSSVNGSRRRGRQDAHLPLHLRGVLFKDLPEEWKAVSEHMRPVEEPEPSADFAEWQRMTREKRAKDRLRKEKEEQENLVFATRAENLRRRKEWSDAVKEGAVDSSPVGSPGKLKRVIKVQKVFSARLGPSTYGVPENIDDSSSDEEIEIELDEDLDQSLLTPVSKTPRLIKKYTPSISKQSTQSPDNSEDAHATSSPTPSRAVSDAPAETEQERTIRLKGEELKLDDVSSDEDDDEEYMGTAAGTYGEEMISGREQMINYMRKLSNSEEEFQVRLQEFESYRRWERKEIKKTMIYAVAEGIQVKDRYEAWRWRRIHPTCFPKLNPPPKVFGNPRKARPYQGTTFPSPIQPSRFVRQRESESEKSKNMFSGLPGARSESKINAKRAEDGCDPHQTKGISSEHLETSNERKEKESKAQAEKDKLERQTPMGKGVEIATTPEPASERVAEGEHPTGSTLTATSASALNVQTPSPRDRAPSQEDDSEILAKARRDALKHYPKKPSHLSNVKTMSPIQPPPPPPVSADDFIASATCYADITDDPEVLAAIAAVPEEDFVVRRWTKFVPQKARSVSVETNQYF
jgi:hypothetical protein